MAALLVEAAERGDRAAASRALELLPEEPDARVLRARAELARVPPNLGQARAELLAAREAGVKDAEIAGRLGVIAQALGEDPLALAELEAHAESKSPLPDALLALGRVRLRGGNSRGAETAFRRATQAAPWSAEAWKDLASSLEESEEPASLRALDRAIELDPAHRGARLARMRLSSNEATAERDAAVLQVLVAAGEKEQALDASSSAELAALEPAVPVWSLLEAEARARSGDGDAARSALERVTSAELPASFRARAASLALQLGLAERTLALTEKAMEAHARGAALRARGAGQLALGRNEAAAKTLRQSAELTPWRSDVHVALAEALLRSGAPEEEIIDQLETARALAPDDPRGRSNLGALYRSRGQRAKAVRTFQEALELEPDSIAALDQLGLLLHEMGRVPEAVTMLERAAELAPQLRRVRYNLGGVLLVAGRPAEAIVHLEAACDEGVPGPKPPANARKLLAEARRRAAQGSPR